MGDQWTLTIEDNEVIVADEHGETWGHWRVTYGEAECLMASVDPGDTETAKRALRDLIMLAQVVLENRND